MSTSFTAITTNRDRVLAFWRYIDEHNHAALSDLLADDFTMMFLPSSLGGFGIPVRNKEQSITFLCEMPEKGVASLRLKPTEWVETEDAVVAHENSLMVLPTRMSIWEYSDSEMGK
ncbi:hypothetical protein BDQ17DRAFT_1547670 [Cyathus striatus]|nr:hypothetical protein BDQ17DRAFT_1547670 [Cyathus striatus]